MSAEGSSDAVRAGEVLAGRYRVGALIGRGGYGSVYRAQRLAGGPDVAVKVVDEVDAELAARFAREATIAMRLTSPRTVRCLDHGVAPSGAPFMVLELLEGQSMFDWLEQHQALSPRDALVVTAQILESLAEAHALGIVHRDIKPENVFVTSRLGESPAIKLLDFGIAKQALAPGLTVAGAVVGTPSYMAPEQTTGGQVDPRTDLYALGLLLAEMVTGRTVMGTGGPMTIMTAQARRGPVPLGDDVRASIVGPLVERAVEKDPGSRFQSAAEMSAAVEAKLAELDANTANAASRAPEPFAPMGHPSPTQVSPTGPTQISATGPTHVSTTYVSAIGPTQASPTSAPSAPAAPLPPQLVPRTRFDPAPVAPRPPAPPAAPRRRGPIALPLAIVGFAALVAVAIVAAVQIRSPQRVAPRRTNAPVPENETHTDDTAFPRLRTTDVAEIRRVLLTAGYQIHVDSGGPDMHTFTPVKVPCGGAVVITTQADAATANRSAEALRSRGGGGTYLVEGRQLVSIELSRNGGPGVDQACTSPVVALLTR